MDSLRILLELILHKYGRQVSREVVRRRMERGLPRILRRMEKQHVTPEHAAPRVVVRDALFRLWRAVIPSGDLADLVRDLQDDRVLEEVEPLVTPGTGLEEVVRWTMNAALDLAF